MLIPMMVFFIQSVWSACHDPASPITKYLVRYPQGDLWCKVHETKYPNALAYVTQAVETPRNCEVAQEPSFAWTPGCKSALLNRGIGRSNLPALKSCFQGLRTKILRKILTEDGMKERLALVPRFLQHGCNYLPAKDDKVGPVDCDAIDPIRKRFLETMSREFNPLEEEFLGAVFTLYGEARTVGRERIREMQAIIKVMENRSKLSGGNLLDVALDANQFSCFNPDDRNWAMTLLGSYEAWAGYDDAILAYAEYPSVQFTCGKFTSGKELDEVACQTHLSEMLNYHARWLPRSEVYWSTDVTPVEFKVSGVALSQTPQGKVNPLYDSHYFYTGKGEYRPGKNPYRK